MHRIVGILVFYFLFISVCGFCQDSKNFSNRYPILLVHGFGGWGPEEL
jgi:hypothetical protein